jgi:hypothetical protein
VLCQLNSQQAGIPALLETQKQELRDADAHVHKLRPFRTVWDDLQRLETELPEAMQRVECQQQELTSTEQAITKVALVFLCVVVF